MSRYTHARRLLSIITPLGNDAVLIDGFTGRESISSLTELDLDLISLPDNPIHPPSLIGQRVTLGIIYDRAGNTRYFNGIVRNLTLVGSDGHLIDTGKAALLYKAEVVPSMWLLTLNMQTRVFQNKTVIEISKEVLGAYSIKPEDDTTSVYQVLDYCTQYRETDYDFLTRILEEHGILFYFKHTKTDHKLVLADNSTVLSPCPTEDSFEYYPQMLDSRVGDFYGMFVSQFEARSELVPGKHARWEYRYTQFGRQASEPAFSASKVDTGDNDHEFFDYSDGPSGFAKRDVSDGRLQAFQTQLQDVARDRSDARSIEIRGASNASLLCSGFAFTLTKHPDVSRNTKYVLISVSHEARQQPPFCGDEIRPYRNTFTAHPAKLAYRPAMTRAKPRVHGVVTGKVVAPPGEDSYLDKYGRVCVQFWWDRGRPPNQTDNTLLRVAQLWAGSGWGTFFWPRAGDEVLIDFIEGDPDAPVIVGSLYNGVNKPKYDPPTEYTRSGIVTRSSKDGSAENANELRFEDLKDSEQIYLHAERDYDVQVEHNHHVEIGSEQHITVKENQYKTLQGEAHRHVVKDQIEAIGGDLNVTVDGAEIRHIKGEKGETIDGNHTLATLGLASVSAVEGIQMEGGMTVTIEAGMSARLSVAGHYISVDATGITIQGPLKLLGAPVLPIVPQLPALPKSPIDALFPEEPEESTDTGHRQDGPPQNKLKDSLPPSELKHPGFPNLPPENAVTFASVEPQVLPPGTQLLAVGDDSGISANYFTPLNLMDVSDPTQASIPSLSTDPSTLISDVTLLLSGPSQASIPPLPADPSTLMSDATSLLSEPSQVSIPSLPTDPTTLISDVTSVSSLLSNAPSQASILTVTDPSGLPAWVGTAVSPAASEMQVWTPAQSALSSGVTQNIVLPDLGQDKT